MTQPTAVILAAGKGTRMNSELPKVAHTVASRAMVEWVVDACRSAGCAKIILVVGYRQEVVRELFAGDDANGGGVQFAVQSEQLGTGHAVLSAKDQLQSEIAADRAPIFVLAGDGPLISGETLKKLLDRHESAQNAATMATSTIEDPTGYGRIVRDSAGKFLEIVEHKNATPDQLTIREINPSYYCFNASDLFRALDSVKRNEASGEYYVTDVPALLLEEGKRVDVVDAVPAEEVLSANTPEQLAQIEAILLASTAGDQTR
ncbi:MAG: NTP transferase domain-containing protein [Planctomycetaceae bacterium]|nr:NTP transferase domain-containing protein [Planctomycetaceae bacterium]